MTTDKSHPPPSWSKRIEDLLRIRPHHTRASDGRKKVKNRRDRIREQLEYYFSDSNLRRDSFMHGVFMKDEYGWLSIDTLITFPILESMKVTSSDILDACSETDFLVVDMEYSRVRRNFEKYPNREISDQLANRSVPAPHQLSLLERRTIYMDGYPILLTQEKLRDLIFEQFPDTRIQTVSIPRNPRTGESYGGAFLEMESEDHAKLLVKKLRWLRTQHVDFRSFVSPDRCPVRVLTMGKFKALKTSYKASKSFAIRNRLEYFVGYRPNVFIPASSRNNASSADAGGDSYDFRIRSDERSSQNSDISSNASSSSVLAMSDINSLAQDSVDIRRSTNASSIRSNSVVLIQNLPADATAQSIRIWLSHSAPVQFLDLDSSTSTAHARFASRRERDFFLDDFHHSRIPLSGQYPSVRALTNDECVEYFEAERDRRRSTISSLGHPDAWTPRNKLTSSSLVETTQSKIPVLSKRHDSQSSGIAFTDTIAGNATLAEPGSSMLYGITRGRHVARDKIRNVMSGKENLWSNEPEVVNRGLKRSRSEDSDDANPKREKIGTKKKTRRGKRGGAMARTFRRNN
jgi:lupus La protein